MIPYTNKHDTKKEKSSDQLKQIKIHVLSAPDTCVGISAGRLFSGESSLTVTLPRASPSLIGRVVTEIVRQKKAIELLAESCPSPSSSPLLLLPSNVRLALVRAAAGCRVHS